MVDRVNKNKTIKEFDKMLKLNDLVVKNEDDDLRLNNLDFVESV